MIPKAVRIEVELPVERFVEGQPLGRLLTDLRLAYEDEVGHACTWHVSALPDLLRVRLVRKDDGAAAEGR